MNPKNLGGIANQKQQPWKAPLPVLIEELYEERFGRSASGEVVSLEELARQQKVKKQTRREERLRKKESGYRA